MGRNRLPEDTVRVKVPLRLPGVTVDKIKQIGPVTKVIEKAVDEYLEKNEKK